MESQEIKIIEKTESRERCAEAGWYAFDYLTDRALDEDFIVSLCNLGSLIYLRQLKKPFFKIESDHYIIKGLLGDDFFRIAVHRDHFDELQQIERQINYSS